MAVYYNDNDPFCVAWLRELIKAGLIADGEVDDRSIESVQPGDLRGFVQCHFFAGIGGWGYALRLAGWSDSQPVWTASCPCQALSSAARGRFVAADLWAPFVRLVARSRPGCLFGEQVPNSSWFARASLELEALDYDVGAAILPALCVGNDHARPRIYFASHPNSDSQSKRALNGKVAWVQGRRRFAGGVVPTNGLSRDVVALSGFGNAIVPQVAAEFIQAYCEARR